LTFKPTLNFHIGTHQVEIILSDSIGLKNTYPFELIVYDFPRFSGAWKTQDIKINSVLLFDLPIIEEFTPITVTHYKPLPSFISFNYPKYIMRPSKKSDINNFEITGLV
jgi:hypothetical protein